MKCRIEDGLLAQDQGLDVHRLIGCGRVQWRLEAKPIRQVQFGVRNEHKFFQRPARRIERWDLGKAKGARLTPGRGPDTTVQIRSTSLQQRTSVRTEPFHYLNVDLVVAGQLAVEFGWTYVKEPVPFRHDRIVLKTRLVIHGERATRNVALCNQHALNELRAPFELHVGYLDVGTADNGPIPYAHVPRAENAVTFPPQFNQDVVSEDKRARAPNIEQASKKLVRPSQTTGTFDAHATREIQFKGSVAREPDRTFSSPVDFRAERTRLILSDARRDDRYAAAGETRNTSSGLP